MPLRILTVLIIFNSKDDDDDDEEEEEEEEENSQKNSINQNPRCTLNHFWCIRQFDSIFKKYYREHSFLLNSQVPRIIREEFEKTPSVNMEELGFDMISFVFDLNYIFIN